MDNIVKALETLRIQHENAKTAQFVRFEHEWNHGSASIAPWTFYGKPEEAAATDLIANLAHAIQLLEQAQMPKTRTRRK